MSKYYKKKKQTGLVTGIIIGAAVSSLLFLMIYFVFLRGNTNTPTENPQGITDMRETEPAQKDTLPPAPETTEPSEETKPEGTEPLADLEVMTPFCTLYYPGEWSSNVRSEQQDQGYGYAVRFYGSAGGQETELFSVFFGYGTDDAEYVGTHMKGGISTDVYVEIADFDPDNSWDGAAAAEIYAMQVDADYLVEKLEEELFFQMPEDEELETVPDLSDAVLETPYCTLYYPGEWKDAVSWEITSEGDSCMIAFTGLISGQNMPVFAVTFNDPEDTGFRMGTWNDQGRDIAVCLTLYDFPQDQSWGETERNLFLTLQEQAFTMLEKLTEDSRYTSILN